MRIGASGRNCQTAPRVLSTMHVRLAFDVDDQTGPEPGQIDFSRLLVMGNAAMILNSVRLSTREEKTADHRRAQTTSNPSLPTRSIHATLPYTEGVRRRSTDAESTDTGPRTQDPGQKRWAAGQLSRVIFMTEPEGRAWRATDRLLADRCRGAPRNPKAPVMLAKPQFEPRS